ncbi:MAG: hypothetical protein IPK83_01400 [Planctomycetes bacterium]|nr:hypothetical protein [Planctomycetota bacterium]
MEQGKHLWWSRTKSVLVIVSITMLIWLAADQNVALEEECTIVVQLGSDVSDRYAGFAESPFSREFTLKLKGRRNRLRDFTRYADSNALLTAYVDKDMPTSSEARTVTMDKILSGIHELKEHRLTLLSVVPNEVKVLVDEYTTIRDVRVKPDYGDLKVTPEFLRNTVSARVPRFLAKILGEAPIAIAIPAQSIQSVQRTGDSFEVAGVLKFDLPENLDPKMRIEFEPSREVTIAGRIEAMTATESKGPIQIYWSIPDEVQRDYVVMADQMTFRVHIDVTGPKDRLPQLEARRIRAFIDVLAGDVDGLGSGKEIVRDVRFVLPADFQDCAISNESQPIQARFRLEPRPRGPSTVTPSVRPIE